MLYRCKNCQHEEARGCLPTVGCGIYLVGLMFLWVAGANVVLGLLRDRLLASRPPMPAPEPDDPAMPWWAWLILVPAGFAFAFLGAALLDKTFQTIEWLAFARRRCPSCGSRRWSWGFTRGMGL